MMQAPKLQKITVNMGVGMAKTDSKVLRAATEQLATIAGQQPSVRRARKSIAAFKLREGNPVGLAVTLRGDRGYEFLDRLVSIAIPRIRDFRGLNPRSFDGRGNYSMGVREQIIFPEIDYDSIDQVYSGIDITITTSATSDAEAFALLHAFGLPFSADRRPRGLRHWTSRARSRAAAGTQPRLPRRRRPLRRPRPPRSRRLQRRPRLQTSQPLPKRRRLPRRPRPRRKPAARSRRRRPRRSWSHPRTEEQLSPASRRPSSRRGDSRQAASPV